MRHKTFIAGMLFVLTVLFLGWLYDYQQIAGYGPASLHLWRQADSNSLALCYYENGMHFFQPKVHNVGGGDNAAAGEFPILYFIAAGLYHLFGPHAIVLRLLNYLIFLAGLFFLLRAVVDIFDDILTGLFFPVLVLSSPLLAFYGFNFLPNTPAFGLMLTAFFLCYRFYQNHRLSWFYGMTALVLLAGLIKVSALVPYLALFGTGLLLRLLPGQQAAYRQYFPALGHLLASLFLVAIPVAAWYLWANHYNEVHGSGVFSTYIRPIWQMASTDITNTIHLIWTQYHKIYFTSETLVLFLALLIFQLVRSFWRPLPLALLLWLMFLGSIAFLLLFYYAILVHHYYMIDIFGLLLLVFSLTVDDLRRWWSRRLPAWLPGLLILALPVANILVTNRRMYDYYNPEGIHMQNINQSFFKTKALHAFLQERNISYADDLVISIPDVTPNATLYYLNLKGWNTPFDGPVTDERLKNSYIPWGATYLIVSDPALLQREELQEVLRYPAGVFDNSIYFFDLKAMAGELSGKAKRKNAE